MKLVSISGCGHTGTTLMAVILGSHKNIHLHPKETRAFVDGNIGIIDDLLETEYDRNIIYVVEKTPKHIHHIDEISHRYKDAKFIFMVRDPRDIVASLYKRTRNWKESIGRVQLDLSSTKRYENYGLLVKYEDLVGNFDKTMTVVCNYLNIEYSHSMKEFYKNSQSLLGIKDVRYTDGVGKDHEMRRGWQVSQPLFNGAGRWKTELNKSQQLEVYNTLSDIGSHFGYNLDPR